jgi:nucleotide-binding universal stress UspA family protein
MPDRVAGVDTSTRFAVPAAVPVFDRVLCATDGSPGNAAAVREAIALAPCGAGLSFVAVCLSAGGVASLDGRRARVALEQAQGLAGAHGAHADTAFVQSADVCGALLARCGDRTLLVVGSHGSSRMRGSLAGATATSLAQRATGPLLVARGAGCGARAPQRVLVAVDASAAATALVRLAGTIAATCGGYVHLVHVPGRDYGSRTRHRLAELSTELIALTGAEPVVDVTRRGHAGSQIAELAARCDASLVVVGRRGLTGQRTLGSVSEHVVHAAPCSVLVAPALAR